MDTYPAFTRSFSQALQTLGWSAPYEKIMALAKISLEHCLVTLAKEYRVSQEELD